MNGRAQSAAKAVPLTLTAGLSITGVGISSSLLVAFAAMPPFYTGIWFQSEPMMIAYIGSAFFTVLGLLLLSWRRADVVSRFVCHPFVMLPALLGTWSLAVAPWARAPGLSVLGTPEMGQGVVWFLSFAGLTAGAMLVYRIPRFRKPVACLALAVAWIVALLTLFDRIRPPPTDAFRWAPLFFPDYLAFFGIFSTVIALVWLPRQGAWTTVTILASGFAIIVISANWSALALSVAVVGVSLAANRWFQRTPDPAFRRGLAGVALLIPFVVMAGVAVIAFVMGRVSTAISTSWSRHLLNKMPLQIIPDTPAGLITGHGWGHFADLVIAYGAQEGVRLFGGFSQGPNWDALAFAYFHSHNALVEALLASGIVGFLIAWALPASFPLYARRAVIPVAGAMGILTAGLETVWFQFSLSMPFFAVALGGIAAAPRRTHDLRFARPLTPPALALAAALMAFGVWAYARDASDARARIKEDAVLEATPPTTECGNAFSDHGRGGVHLAWAYRNYVLHLGKRIADGNELTAAETERLRFYLCAATGRDDESSSLRLSVVELIVRSELGFTPIANVPIVREHLESWEGRLFQFLAHAPRRSDMAIAYLAWRLTEGREDIALRDAERLLMISPADPVGLWFSGVVLLAKPETAAVGAQRLRRSLDEGIERFMPVDPNIKRRILETAGT